MVNYVATQKRLELEHVAKEYAKKNEHANKFAGLVEAFDKAVATEIGSPAPRPADLPAEVPSFEVIHDDLVQAKAKLETAARGIEEDVLKNLSDDAARDAAKKAHGEAQDAFNRAQDRFSKVLSGEKIDVEIAGKTAQHEVPVSDAAKNAFKEVEEANGKILKDLDGWFGSVRTRGFGGTVSHNFEQITKGKAFGRGAAVLAGAAMTLDGLLRDKDGEDKDREGGGRVAEVIAGVLAMGGGLVMAKA